MHTCYMLDQQEKLRNILKLKLKPGFEFEYLVFWDNFFFFLGGGLKIRLLTITLLVIDKV